MSCICCVPESELLAISNGDFFIYQLPPPLLDSFGRVISEAPPDDSPARCGIATALAQLSPYFPEDQVEPMFAFFVEKGLGDRSEDVRKCMLIAAVAAITDHGKVCSMLLKMSVML